MKKIFLTTIATLMIAASAMAQISPGATSVEDIGHNAENLYDWGRERNWTKARADLAALKAAIAKFEATGSTANLQGAKRRLAAIDAAVRNRQPRALMHAANEMTFVAAELSRPFKPQVPPEVTLLDYDGRELQLWAEEGNVVQLHETRMRLEEVWNSVRPAVIAKGGETEAQQFDALVSQLKLAQTAKDFAAAATPILDSVDSLELVFTRRFVRPADSTQSEFVLRHRRTNAAYLRKVASISLLDLQCFRKPAFSLWRTKWQSPPVCSGSLKRKA